MKRVLPAAVAALLVAAASLLLLRPDRPAYLFLITLDTTRADHVAIADQNDPSTPRLAELAAQGMVFDRAYALIPITLPSHAAMLYSMPPHRLGVHNNMERFTAPGTSLAEVFRDHGYRTGAVVSLGVLRRGFETDAGFEEYHDGFPPALWYKTAAAVNREAFAMIERLAGSKAFFWIHYSDPHGPYFPPCYEGTFSASFEQRTLFKGNSRDLCMVDLAIEARPGANDIRLHTDIPHGADKPAVNVDRIAYMNFMVTPSSGDPAPEVRVPVEWKRTLEHGKTTYFSRRPDATIRIINHGATPQRISISFSFNITTDIENTRSLYREEVAYMDGKIGELLDFLKHRGMFDDSVFLVMGDHGEGLGEHRDLVGHMHYLNKLYTHVPLLLAGKGVKQRGHLRKELVSNLHVAPTLLSLAGISPPETMQGTSLLKPVENKPLLLETYAPQAYCDGFSLIDYPNQIIYYPDRSEKRYETFNLSEDRLGCRDLFDAIKGARQKQKAVARITGIADDIRRANRDRTRGPLTEEQQKILESLGYL